MIDQTIVAYDAETVDYAAWQLAQRDGYKYGRCWNIGGYVETVTSILAALEDANNLRAKGEFD